MLKIINNLKPFFEDCYRRINVREYAKIVNVSPPTASKLLSYYTSKGLLVREIYKNYILFHANKESNEFISLSIIYWENKLKRLINLVEKNVISPTIVLFGSMSKAETKNDSDVDLAIFGNKKYIPIEKIENELKRKIQIFWFDSIREIKNNELANNIINGHILTGRISL